MPPNRPAHCASTLWWSGRARTGSCPRNRSPSGAGSVLSNLIHLTHSMTFTTVYTATSAAIALRLNSKVSIVSWTSDGTHGLTYTACKRSGLLSIVMLRWSDVADIVTNLVIEMGAIEHRFGDWWGFRNRFGRSGTFVGCPTARSSVHGCLARNWRESSGICSFTCKNY